MTIQTGRSDGPSTRSTVSGVDDRFGNPNARVELFARPIAPGAISILAAAIE